jgi:hypothetical protein
MIPYRKFFREIEWEWVEINVAKKDNTPNCKREDQVPCLVSLRFVDHYHNTQITQVLTTEREMLPLNYIYIRGS